MITQFTHNTSRTSCGHNPECRLTWGKAPPRGKAPPHLNTNLVCEWVHLMSNDAPCWKSVYETNQLELNNNLCKQRMFAFFTYLYERGALPRGGTLPHVTLSIPRLPQLVGVKIVSCTMIFNYQTLCTIMYSACSYSTAFNIQVGIKSQRMLYDISHSNALLVTHFVHIYRIC